MRDVLDEVAALVRARESQSAWQPSSERFAAPRANRGPRWRSGSDETAVGSVSGGCVEGAVYEVAREVVQTGTARLEEYGVSDDDAFAVGLTCGGILHVFVEPVTRETFPELPAVAASIRAGEPVAVATVLAGPGHLGAHLAVWADRTAGTLGSARLDAAVVDDARGMLEQGTTGERRYGPDGERRLDDLAVFVAAYAPPPTMYVFGAIDFAAAVARVGAFLGYRVTVCDARPVFATPKRFPDAHEVVERVAAPVPRASTGGPSEP